MEPRTPSPDADVPGRPATVSSGTRRAAAALLLCTLPALAGLPVLAMRSVEADLRGAAHDRAEARAEGIVGRVDRLRHLTVALAGHPDLRALLASDRPTAGTAAAGRVNDWLADLAAASGASILYAIDAAGLTRAASNHDTGASLVGNVYTWRPYFRDAMRGAEARYYAVGATTDVAGYYFARPVRAARAVSGTASAALLGVAVVKVDLEAVQHQWESAGDPLLLLDENGIAIVTSRSSWRFRATGPIGTAELAAFRAEQKYGDAALAPLDASASPLLADRIVLDGRPWLVTRAALPDRGWTLVELTPTGRVRAAGLAAGLATLLVAGLSGVALLYGRERRRRTALALEARDAVRMRHLNRQLEAEIVERRRAEAELDETQHELLQASKLAALGRMSAAVAHEVNQPLAALRTYAASARLLLERGRDAEVAANLDEIEALTDRLATVTSDLKVFARRSDDAHDPVELARCIERTRAQLAPLLAETGAILEVVLPIERVHVLGSAVRIEQVLSNLVRNAIDATSDRPGERRVRMELATDADDAVLRVADNGEGVAPEALAHLFDPFFTTKPVGQGVGLGLAISYGIVQEMGGRLRVRNLADGGALFSLRLRRVREPSAALDATRGGGAGAAA